MGGWERFGRIVAGTVAFLAIWLGGLYTLGQIIGLTFPYPIALGIAVFLMYVGIQVGMNIVFPQRDV